MQMSVRPEYIIATQQQVIAEQQHQIVMLKAALRQLSGEKPYREGDDPETQRDG